MQLDVSCVQVIEHEEFIYKPHIDWSSVDKLAHVTYSLNTAEILSNLQLDHDVINCQDISCNNASQTYTCLSSDLIMNPSLTLPILNIWTYALMTNVVIMLIFFRHV